MSDALDTYVTLLNDLKSRIAGAQTRAALAANRELLRLYWEIGRLIAERQAHEGWGAAVIPRLATDLAREIPDAKGFSERNLKRMLRFAQEYPALDQRPTPIEPPERSEEGETSMGGVGHRPIPIEPPERSEEGETSMGGVGHRPTPIVPQPVAQFSATASSALGKTLGPNSEKVPQPVAPPSLTLDPSFLLLPWGHHILLFERVRDLTARAFYVTAAVREGWSRDVLGLMIKSQTHLRQGAAVTNFATSLPAPQSDLARQTLKDPYVFDFLALDTGFREHELELGLLAHLERFLLELGVGFAFVGRQQRLTLGDEELFVDLLFYHLKLRAFVVVELKVGPFKAEYAGKMNLYLNVVDDTLRHPSDAPTIGLILCQDKKQLVAEYALRGMDKPIGVSEYELTRALPTELSSVLPTIEAIEAELGHDEGPS